MGHEPAVWASPLPRAFELSPSIIRRALGLEVACNACARDLAANANLPGRPPALCAGCPHRVPFFELKRMRAIVLGDIGCYTLGALPPLSTLESAIDMGASVSMGHGFEVARALEKERGDARVAGGARPVFSVIGDSTFAHSGLSGVISAVYNAASGNVLILDNRTTAMTGGQGNPVSGITLQGRPSHELDLPRVLEACGVDEVIQANALDVKEVRAALKLAASHTDKFSVVICQAPCVVEYKVRGIKRVIDEEACRGCGACVRIGCPAISRDMQGRAVIDANQCNGCGQCEQYCAFGAITTEE